MGIMQKLHPGFIMQYRQAIFSSFKVIFIFSLFAFITSLAREIIKDMEDYQGDKATGGRTMPIVWGIRSGKLVAFFSLIITALLLLFAVYNTVRSERVIVSANTLYILLALILPLFLLALFVLRSTQKEHFKKASLLLKFIMLMGLCYSFIFYYH